MAWPWSDEARDKRHDVWLFVANGLKAMGLRDELESLTTDFNNNHANPKEQNKIIKQGRERYEEELEKRKDNSK